MSVSLENSSEEGRACRENDFMCLDLILVTGKRNIKEILVLSELPKGGADVGLEVIPPQAELFRGHLGTFSWFHSDWFQVDILLGSEHFVHFGSVNAG